MKKDTRVMLVVVAVLIVLFMMSRGYSYAKYASTSIWNYYLESKGFYFKSTDLKTGNTDNNWDGDSINFSFQNYENNDLVTEYDINYRVTCTIKGEAASYSNCYLNGTNSNTYTGTLSGPNKATKQDYFDIVSNEEITGLTVEIKVESTSPYSKTLTGEYVLSRGTKEIGSLDIKYTANDSSDSVTVTNSYNENKCVKLSFDPSKVRIDNNSSILSSNTDANNYINEVIFRINKKDSLEFTFYRTDFDTTLQKSDFTIVESDEC